MPTIEDEAEETTSYKSLRGVITIFKGIGGALFGLGVLALLAAVFGATLGIFPIFTPGGKPSLLNLIPPVSLVIGGIGMMLMGLVSLSNAERLELEVNNADNLETLCADQEDAVKLLGRIEANTGRAAASLERLASTVRRPPPGV